MNKNKERIKGKKCVILLNSTDNTERKLGILELHIVPNIRATFRGVKTVQNIKVEWAQRLGISYKAKTHKVNFLC